MIVAILVVIAFAWYVMNGEERRRVTSTLVRAGLIVTRVATRKVPQYVQFQQALEARTRWVFVTPLIAVINVITFIMMAWAEGPVPGSDTLVAWGGNFGPRTTNGEWWRLLSSAFVHYGPLHLAATIAGLLQAGLLLERLAGPLAFCAAYFAAAIISAFVALAAYPTDVTAGASGAIAGMYGLLFAGGLFGWVRPSPLTIPPAALQRLLPAAALFVLYNALTSTVPANGEASGFLTGVAVSILLARRLGDAKPPARRAGIALAAAAVIVVFAAVPLRGLSDVKPRIQQVIGLEERTTSAYRQAVNRFKLGRLHAVQLAGVIDRDILPEFRDAHAYFSGLTGVPDEHKPLVADVKDYLRLRIDSWRVRSEALHTANMKRLSEADRLDRLARLELEKIKPNAEARGGQE